MNKTILNLLFILFAAQFSAAQEQPLKIHIFYSNDVQANIFEQKARFLNPEFPPLLGGGASMAGIIAKYRENGEPVLLFDAGDFNNPAHPLSAKSGGSAMAGFMNYLGYNAAVPGLLDLSDRWENVRRVFETVQFPILAANLELIDQNTTLPNLKPWEIFEIDGVRLGVFGIVSQSAEQLDDTDIHQYLRFLPEEQAAENAVAGLKSAGADIIIALAHLGLPYETDEDWLMITQMDSMKITRKSYMNTMNLAHQVAGIDIIFSGQIHRGYDLPWEDPVNHTLCFQNYANGGNLGLVTLLIDRESGQLLNYEFPAVEGSLVLLSNEQFLPEKNTVEFLSALKMKYLGDDEQPLGYTAETLTLSLFGASPMSNLTCDAMLASSGADFAINTFQSIRSTLQIGPVFYTDLIQAFPFGNKMVVHTLIGAELKSLLEGTVSGKNNGVAIGGGRVVIDDTKANGSKIAEFTIGGWALLDSASYKVVVSDYLSEGNFGMDELAGMPENLKEIQKITIRDAVADYLRSNKTLTAKNDNRWVRKKR